MFTADSYIGITNLDIEYIKVGSDIENNICWLFFYVTLHCGLFITHISSDKHSKQSRE